MRTFLAFLLIATLAINVDFTSAAPADSPDTDFNTIDELGGYHFGYNDGRIARQEERSPEGVVRGAYSYVDADGQIQVVTYTADKHNGFLVSGTNIPKSGTVPEIEEGEDIIQETPAGIVQDTPEVAAAKIEHAAAVRSVLLGEIPSVPLSVEYTPEVAAARAEHLNAYGQINGRNIGDLPVVYASQPAVAPGIQYHPDYLPYAGL